MVGPLMYKELDPDHKGRGKGTYYYRGCQYGWAKYSKLRDAMLKRGPIAIGRGPYKHTEDYNSYKEAPSYPTNRRRYNHVRNPSVITRMKQARRMVKIYG